MLYKQLICSLLLTLLFVSTGWSQTRAIRPVKLQTPSGESVDLYQGSYALVIGVSKYQDNAWIDLNSVQADVEAVRGALEGQGFIVQTVMNPTESMLRDQFEDFIDAYGYEPENRLLFYYAGHGHTQERNERQFGYLVPADAPDPYSNEREFSRKALKMEQIRSWARQIEAKHALFVFDSCFSGSVFQSRAALVPEDISFSTTKPVRQFIAAGTADQTVPAESVFRPLFIRGIEGQADLDRDGYVTGVELGMYLQKEVPQYRTGQTPQYGKIRDPYLDEGNFVFEAGSKDKGAPQAKTATLYIGENDLIESANPKKWRLTGTPSKNHVYTGEVKDGRPNGQGLIRLINGISYSGNFKKGFPDGQGVFKYPDGRQYVGSVKKGFPDGQGTYIWAEGSIYIGGFKDGKKHGEGTYTDLNGARYVGGWEDDRQSGQGTYTWPDGSKYVGRFKDGRRDGTGTYTASDGTIQSGIWEEGKFLSETKPVVAKEKSTVEILNNKDEQSQTESPIIVRSGQNLLQNNKKLDSISAAAAQLPSKAPPVVVPLPKRTEANLLNLMEGTITVPIGQPRLKQYKQAPQSNSKKCAFGLPDGLSEKKQFAFAEKMIEDGMLASARDYLQCYRASKPQGEFRFVAMKLEGEVLLQMGESYWPQAQILFEEWLQENPNDSEVDFARLQLGKIHFRFDRPQVAEETLSSIPSSSSLYGPARNLMGQALFQRMLRYQERNSNAQANDLAPRVVKYHQEALQHKLTEPEREISNYQVNYVLNQNKDFE